MPKSVSFAPCVQQDVVGLDVPVDHAPLVGVVQPVRRVHAQRQRDLAVERTLSQPGPKRAARDVLHDDVGRQALLALVEHADDVGVVELGHGDGFRAEARAGLGVHHEGGVQHLDGPVALHHLVVGEEDGAHAAATDAALHDVASVGQRGVGRGQGRSQCGPGQGRRALGLYRTQSRPARRPAHPRDDGVGPRDPGQGVDRSR